MQEKFSTILSKQGRTDKEVIDYIENTIGRESDVAIPNGFAAAFVGLMYNWDLETHHAVYSKELMIETLMIQDQMDYDEALEFLDFNTWNAYPPQGSHPVYINTLD